jgi:choline dehydrogenase
VDLPSVGSNPQDNTESRLNTKAAVNFTSLAPACTYGFMFPASCLQAWEAGTGPYAQGLTDAIMFKSSVAAFNEQDIFMWASAASARVFWPLSATVQELADPPSTWSFSMVKMHVHGKLGTLNLTSNNPQDMPDINFRFNEDENGELDLQALSEEIDFGRKVANSVAVPIGPFNDTSPWPGNVPCDTKDYILKQTWSHHATSTCSIGADHDPLTVLDSNFRQGREGVERCRWECIP